MQLVGQHALYSSGLTSAFGRPWHHAFRCIFTHVRYLLFCYTTTFMIITTRLVLYRYMAIYLLLRRHRSDGLVGDLSRVAELGIPCILHSCIHMSLRPIVIYLYISVCLCVYMHACIHHICLQISTRNRPGRNATALISGIVYHTLCVARDSSLFKGIVYFSFYLTRRRGLPGMDVLAKHCKALQNS